VTAAPMPIKSSTRKQSRNGLRGNSKSSWLCNALLKQYRHPSAISVRESPSHHEGATRPEAWTGAASRFAELRNGCSGQAAGSGHAFPCNCGVRCPVSRRLRHPAYTAYLITAASCHSSGRRDNSWMRVTGVGLKGCLCSDCTSRRGALCAPEEIARFPAISRPGMVSRATGLAQNT